MNGLIAFLRKVVLASLTGAVVGVLPAQAIAEAQPDYALSMHGDVALPADFTHFPYASQWALSALSTVSTHLF